MWPALFLTPGNVKETGMSTCASGETTSPCVSKNDIGGDVAVEGRTTEEKDSPDFPSVDGNNDVAADKQRKSFAIIMSWSALQLAVTTATTHLEVGGTACCRHSH